MRYMRQFADIFFQAATFLNAIADTYTACVDQLVQCLFLAICVYGGDACDAYAHSLAGFKVPTFFFNR